MLIRLLMLTLAVWAAQQPQPTFRSGVDLIRVDASIVDKSGQPVPDLKPEDFVVRIDGAPRKVSFATFYGAAPDATMGSATAAAPSFATNVNRTPGRVVVFVVDLESMTPGYEKLVLDTAGSLLDRLSPSDAAGLVVIPGKGVDLTREHNRVKTALAALRGAAPRSFQQHVISIREADAFAKLDRRIMGEVIERECRRFETSCPSELMNESRELLVEADRRIMAVLTTLSDVSTRLVPLDAPKSIVLLSAGLPFFQDSMSRFRELERRTAESGVSMFVVQLEQPETDASSARMAGAASLPRTDLGTGLSNIAGVTGGLFFFGVGKAVGVFDRIRTEITNSYQLGVAALPEDSDGKTHQIDVQVARSGLTVRARKQLIASSVPRPAPTAVDVINQPIESADLALATSAYSTRGEESSTLKVILLLELFGAGSPGPAPSYAISISRDGQTVFQTADKAADVDAAGARAIVGTQLAPGQYRLRAAMVGPNGRPGSLEMPFGVGLRQAGAFQFSDLLVGTATDRFAPATHIAPGTDVSTLLELYTAEPSQFDDVSVALEMRKGTEAVPMKRAAATISQTALDRRRVAEGRLPAEGLTPGPYTVSAIISKGATPIGRVSRTIVVKAP
jgi:VWFA-related protein